MSSGSLADFRRMAQPQHSFLEIGACLPQSMLPFGNKTCQSCTALESIRAQWPYDASVGKGGRARTRTDAKEAPPAELLISSLLQPFVLGPQKLREHVPGKGWEICKPSFLSGDTQVR